MRTRSVTTHEAVELTTNYLAEGNLLHISPKPDLPMLKAMVPRRGGVDNDTHTVRTDSEPAVHLHDNPRVAFVIGAIAAGRDDGFDRLFAVDAELDERRKPTGEYAFYATEYGKQYMARESKYDKSWDDTKRELTVYVAQVDDPDRYYDLRRREWVVRSDIKEPDESTRRTGKYLVDAFGVTTDFFDALNPIPFNDLLATDDPRVPEEDRVRFAGYYEMLGTTPTPSPLPERE